MTFTKAAIALAMTTGAAQAATLYSADFTQPVSIDHTTAGNPLEPSPQAGANFEIGYTGALASDTTRNFFETDGTSLISSDFGGDHFMQTDAIDVGAWDAVMIDVLADFLGVDAFNNSPSEFISYSYALDGGAGQQFFSFTGAPNGTDLNASASVDTAGFSSLVIRVDANVNGAGDGWEMSALTVDGTAPAAAVVPLPAGLPLLLAGLGAFGLIRRRG